jgi:outer membrane cobalamin receptor
MIRCAFVRPFAARVFAQALVCLAVFGITVTAASARGTGSLAGTVVDPSSQAVVNARVILQSPAGVSHETNTDASGTFRFPDLQPGSYVLRVSSDGFRADAVRVDVRDNERLSIPVQLRLSAVTETLVVTSSLVETPLTDSPSGTTVVTARELGARQYTTVADALRLVPGMAVSAAGGLGSVTSVFPRGGESDFTLVLVDGIKLNSFGGGFDFGHLGTAGISLLEVVRGPQSAVFGADAIGGVVQVRTALGGPASTQASMEWGGYGTSRATLGTTGSVGTLRWGIHGERTTSDGWTDAAPGTEVPVTNDDYRNSSLAVAASWQPRRATTLRFDSHVGRNDRGYPGPFGSNPINVYGGIDTVSRGHNDLVTGALSLTHEVSPRTAVRARTTFMHLDSDFTDAWGGSTSGTRRWSAHVQADRALGHLLSTTVGADLEVERADSSYITNVFSEPLPIDRHMTGLFAEARLRPSSAFSLTAGVRVERIVRSAIDADASVYSPRPDLPTDVVLSPNPRLALSYDLRPSARAAGHWTRLHASAGTGIRVPDAFELAFTDNPSLEPERSRSLDAGIEQALFGARLILDVTGYANTFDDLIVATGSLLANTTRFRSDNIANARARGADVSAAWRTLAGLEARVAYSFVDSSVLSLDDADGVGPTGFNVGDPLLRRPRHQVAADLAFSRPSWNVFLRTSARARVLDVEPTYGISGGLYHSPGYAVVDGGGSVKLGRYAEVFARVENAFDRSYETAFGYPARHRTFTAGLRLAAGH